MDDEDKEIIENELAIIEAMEYNSVLEDTLLSHAKLHGGETKFKLFFDKLTCSLAENTADDSRKKYYSLY